jgi:geranylgeranylglycerol-phosphate geranylgeranyltransferase
MFGLSMNSKLNGYIHLVRPLNLAIVFFTIVAAAAIAGGDLFHDGRIVLAALAGALIAGGGYAINDYFDVEIDAMNRPERPLPSGALTKEEAWWVWRLSSSAGVITSAFLGPEAFGIALFWVLSLYFYGKRLKRTVLVGNLLVATVTGLALIFGGVVIGHVEKSLWPALFAFLVNFAREIVKDIEDRAGDARGNARTLPVVYGIRPALVLATLTILALIGATLAAYHLGVYNQRYLMIVAVVDFMLLGIAISIWKSAVPTYLHRLNIWLKVSMVGGLVAMYIGRV